MLIQQWHSYFSWLLDVLRLGSERRYWKNPSTSRPWRLWSEIWQGHFGAKSPKPTAFLLISAGEINAREAIYEMCMQSGSSSPLQMGYDSSIPENTALLAWKSIQMHCAQGLRISLICGAATMLKILTFNRLLCPIPGVFGAIVTSSQPGFTERGWFCTKWGLCLTRLESPQMQNANAKW